MLRVTRVLLIVLLVRITDAAQLASDTAASGLPIRIYERVRRRHLDHAHWDAQAVSNHLGNLGAQSLPNLASLQSR